MRAKLLLWGSGALALFAIAVPTAVLAGLYLGVIPGIILGVAPTVFLYSATFAVLRKLLPLAPGVMLNVVAAAATLGLGFALATPFANSGRQAFAAADTGDVVPATPVPIAGAVRLERDANVLRGGLPRGGTWECDALCAAFLDMPEVRSVTLAGTDAAGAPLKPATFRLVPKAEAPSAGVAPNHPEQIVELLPEQERETGNWQAKRAARDAKRNALVAKWAMRLATEKTLIAEPAIGDADLKIAISDARETGPHHISIAKVEIRNNAGQVLMRRQRVTASPVAVPLYVAPQGPMLDKGFGIGRSFLHTGPRYFTFKPIEILFSETGLAEPQVAESGVVDMRQRLAAALGRPEPSAYLDLASAWVATLDWRKLETADIDVLNLAIRDPRVTALDRIYDGNEKAVSPALRDSLIVRLLDPATPPRLRSRLNMLVRAMPPGTFAVLTANESALLGNQQLRLVSDALVERLADGGAGATPRLVEILQADVRVDAWWKRQWVMAAVCRAFTQLGPDASAALPAVEKLFSPSRSPLTNTWGDSQNWRVAMVRMGKPVEELAFPSQLSAETVERDRDTVRKMVAAVEARNR
jgi:hypothetical protein